MDLIIYHNACPDGWCAAYIALRKYPNAELKALNYGLALAAYEDLLKTARNRDVLMVDYSLATREQNEQLAREARNLRILDHHKTAREKLAGLDYATFDMDRSGAGLTWDYLFGKDSTGAYFTEEKNLLQTPVFKPRPWWVNYVEDQDLYTWKLADSRKIGGFLRTHPRNIESWDKLWNGEISMLQAIRLGEGIETMTQYYVRSTMENAKPGVFCGKAAMICNTGYVMCSELGHELAVACDGVGIVWFERPDGFTQFSLRSNGDLDVSAMAKAFGGGGHKNAAGFEMNTADARVLIDLITGEQWAEPH